MANKKELTLKELEAQCLEAEKIFKKLHEQLDQARKEEAEIKKQKLEAEREARYKAVVDAYKTFEKLRSEYVNDYGYFTFESSNNKGDSHSWFWNTIGMF